MPATIASAQPPEIDTPKHPLHALTTYELAYYVADWKTRSRSWISKIPSRRSGLTCKPPSTR